MESRPAVQLITEQLISTVVAQARESPRRRKNYNFHVSADANPQRFLNVFLEGSYLRPHRHLAPPKTESFLVLSGQIVVFIFDDQGAVVSTHLVGDGPSSAKGAPAKGIDLEAGLWHSLAAVTPVAVCYEVKPGPWDAATDKEFAPWAPEEGSAEADGYLARLLA